jgi:hypothetical protein
MVIKNLLERISKDPKFELLEEVSKDCLKDVIHQLDTGKWEFRMGGFVQTNTSIKPEKISPQESPNPPLDVPDNTKPKDLNPELAEKGRLLVDDPSTNADISAGLRTLIEKKGLSMTTYAKHKKVSAIVLRGNKELREEYKAVLEKLKPELKPHGKTWRFR